ncbi:hypothetical protein V495_01811, partial [Pseudogymnoascus sp. VKM F-4514 (FW-929)]
MEYVQPFDDHPEKWYPLETILSNWIHLIQVGKLSAIPREIETETEKEGLWTWHSYGEPQVVSTVAAFDRLVEAIESRMPAESLLPAREGPLLSNADLDAAFVLAPSFVRSFMTQVRVPRFEFIAPGLLVPHDREAFVSGQVFTTMYDDSIDWSVMVPPVLLFRATDLTAEFDYVGEYNSLNPFRDPYKIKKGDYVPAGLYSESVARSAIDVAEEGFRLILPFAMRGGEDGAKTSDRRELGKGSVADLFQHEFKPFGGEPQRAQRMERLFDKWTEMVEKGVWDVNGKGVAGTVGRFGNADWGAWKDYFIEPDWSTLQFLRSILASSISFQASPEASALSPQHPDPPRPRHHYPANTMAPVNVPSFAATQLHLLDQELQSELASTSLLLTSTSPASLQRAGVAITNLVIASQRTGLGGKTVLELSLDSAIGEGDLPEHG